jgi:aminoglycoside phosphotransferase (APT) family kinase protein
VTNDNQAITFDLREARATARSLITHHFGGKVNRVVYQPGGLSNFVFLVKHKEGDFAVRISPEPSKINAFIKEQWAMSKAREVGVPTPEILEVGNKVAPTPYMISRRVNGQEATYNPSRMQILHEMGRYAALINAIPTTGFGGTFDWSRNQLSRNETWKDFLHKELKLDARLELMEKHRMVSGSHLERIRSTLEGVTELIPQTALNHGDLRLKNVIVDEDGLISAIIDWEHCVSNLAPHWELSLALHDLSVDEKEEFLEGYGLREAEVTEIAPVMKALNLINYATEIERLAESDNKAGLERYRTRLSGALDLYSF